VGLKPPTLTSPGYFFHHDGMYATSGRCHSVFSVAETLTEKRQPINILLSNSVFLVLKKQCSDERKQVFRVGHCIITYIQYRPNVYSAQFDVFSGANSELIKQVPCPGVPPSIINLSIRTRVC
jgi:hypothetical protein